MYYEAMEQEDYLETLYNLKKQNKHLRISDVAKKLDLSKPSVTQMMKRLKKEGCVDYKPYFPVELTEKGHKIGKKIADRHKVLAEFLTVLKVPSQIQEKDIHGIEHCLSPITLEKLKKATSFLKKKGFDN